MRQLLFIALVLYQIIGQDCSNSLNQWNNLNKEIKPDSSLVTKVNLDSICSNKNICCNNEMKDGIFRITHSTLKSRFLAQFDNLTTMLKINENELVSLAIVSVDKVWHELDDFFNILYRDQYLMHRDIFERLFDALRKYLTGDLHQPIEIVVDEFFENLQSCIIQLVEKSLGNTLQKESLTCLSNMMKQNSFKVAERISRNLKKSFRSFRLVLEINHEITNLLERVKSQDYFDEHCVLPVIELTHCNEICSNSQSLPCRDSCPLMLRNCMGSDFSARWSQNIDKINGFMKAQDGSINLAKVNEKIQFDLTDSIKEIEQFYRKSRDTGMAKCNPGGLSRLRRAQYQSSGPWSVGNTFNPIRQPSGIAKSLSHSKELLQLLSKFALQVNSIRDLFSQTPEKICKIIKTSEDHGSCIRLTPRINDFNEDFKLFSGFQHLENSMDASIKEAHKPLLYNNFLDSARDFDDKEVKVLPPRSYPMQNQQPWQMPPNNQQSQFPRQSFPPPPMGGAGQGIDSNANPVRLGTNNNQNFPNKPQGMGAADYPAYDDYSYGDYNYQDYGGLGPKPNNSFGLPPPSGMLPPSGQDPVFPPPPVSSINQPPNFLPTNPTGNSFGNPPLPQQPTGNLFVGNKPEVAQPPLPPSFLPVPLSGGAQQPPPPTQFGQNSQGRGSFMPPRRQKPQQPAFPGQTPPQNGFNNYGPPDYADYGDYYNYEDYGDLPNKPGKPNGFPPTNSMIPNVSEAPTPSVPPTSPLFPETNSPQQPSTPEPEVTTTTTTTPEPTTTTTRSTTTSLPSSLQGNSLFPSEPENNLNLGFKLPPPEVPLETSTTSTTTTPTPTTPEPTTTTSTTTTTQRPTTTTTEKVTTTSPTTTTTTTTTSRPTLQPPKLIKPNLVDTPLQVTSTPTTTTVSPVPVATPPSAFPDMGNNGYLQPPPQQPQPTFPNQYGPVPPPTGQHSGGSQVNQSFIPPYDYYEDYNYSDYDNLGGGGQPPMGGNGPAQPPPPSGYRPQPAGQGGFMPPPVGQIGPRGPQSGSPQLPPMNPGDNRFGGNPNRMGQSTGNGADFGFPDNSKNQFPQPPASGSNYEDYYNYDDCDPTKDPDCDYGYTYDDLDDNFGANPINPDPMAPWTQPGFTNQDTMTITKAPSTISHLYLPDPPPEIWIPESMAFNDPQKGPFGRPRSDAATALHKNTFVILFNIMVAFISIHSLY